MWSPAAAFEKNGDGASAYPISSIRITSSTTPRPAPEWARMQRRILAESVPVGVVIAGFAGLLAGAFSMGAGEYVSMKVQREVFEQLIHKEAHEIATMPDEEEQFTAYREIIGASPGSRVTKEKHHGRHDTAPACQHPAARDDQGNGRRVGAGQVTASWTIFFWK